MSGFEAPEAPTAAVWTLPDGVDLSAVEVRRQALDTLEQGGVVLLPRVGFELTPRERELMSDTSAMLAGVGETEIRNGRPTIIFEPSLGRIKRHYALVHGRLARVLVRPTALPHVEAMMARFGTWAGDMVSRLFPGYDAALARERITYRPHARTGTQPLHVDSSYGYPTRGCGMLRLFCNVDPAGRPRVWQVGEPFEPFAKRFVPAVTRLRPRASAVLLSRLGVVRGTPTAYDQLIAEIRRLVRRDKEYQRTAPRRIVEFPSGSCWFGITDLVLHGAVSGQHSLDQTFFLPPEAMSDPSRASLGILERLVGHPLR